MARPQIHDFMRGDNEVSVRLDESGQAFVWVTENTTLIGPADVVKRDLERIADALGDLIVAHEQEQKSVYARAIDVLEERGWYQGGFGVKDPDDPFSFLPGGPVDVISALSVAAGGPVGDFPVELVREVRNVLNQPGSVGEWQDHPSTTYDDVVAVLRVLDARERAAA